MKRNSGILMPIFSLPNDYGIGSFGKESYKFVDYLKRARQTVWQILPLVQTGLGNSPYSSVCSYSFNPFFISVDSLKEQKLITDEEARFTLCDKDGYIDYGNLYAVRYPLLRKAFSRFNRNQKAFKEFILDQDFYDYALFMAIKFASGQKHFYEWEDGFKYRDKKTLEIFSRDYAEEILFWQFVQFTAKAEWMALKEYANANSISIMGDMPLYVALDSVDVWKTPELFKLDENLSPTKVAGVPPDYFCEDGQLWGNPVYDYAVHEKDDFKWWTSRMEKALSIYDLVRVDHFRGLDRYYEIDAGKTNAKEGKWIEVPSEKLFDAIHQKVDKSRIIAEDLGVIDDGVRKLLSQVGYPGMKVLSFAFNGEEHNLYLPQNINENSVCYTGTHDNDTLIGLINSASEWDLNNLKNGVRRSIELLDIDGKVDTVKDMKDAIIELGYKSKSNLFIMPMQDALGLGTEYRINEPGTIKEQNWAIRFTPSQFSESVTKTLKKLTIKYKR